MKFSKVKLDTKAVSCSNATTFISACANKTVNTGVIEGILDHRGIGLNEQNLSGNTAFHYYIENFSDSKMAEKFLALQDLNLDIKNNEGLNSFRYALKFNKLPIATEILISFFKRSGESQVGDELNKAHEYWSLDGLNQIKALVRNRGYNILGTLLDHQISCVKSALQNNLNNYPEEPPPLYSLCSGPLSWGAALITTEALPGNIVSRNLTEVRLESSESSTQKCCVIS